MKFKTFDDYLIKPQFSEVLSRSDVDISWNFNLGGRDYSFASPIIPANMDSITGDSLLRYANEHNYFAILHRYMEPERLISLDLAELHNPFGLSVGSIHNDKARIDLILQVPIARNKCNAFICIDIAHGHSAHMRDTIAYIRSQNQEVPIIAGNVATSEGAADLLVWGADFVKVGIGPGSVCTTRTKTGVGVPQADAIMSCSNAIDTFQLPYNPIIADGGMNTPGDVAKAFAMGAGAVMTGSLFAGTNLANMAHTYRGMASAEARSDFTGTYENAEGVSVQPPVTIRSTEDAYTSIHEGLRSSMSYVGARNLNEFPLYAELLEVSSSCKTENGQHFT